MESVTMKPRTSQPTPAFTFGGMLWPQLLLASRLALRPARVMMSMVLVLLVMLIWWIPGLWLPSENLPGDAVREAIAPAFAEAVRGLFTLDLRAFWALVVLLFYGLPVTLMREYPWSLAAIAGPLVLVWTIFGGAISRSVAEEHARGVRQSWTESLAFALSRVWSLFFSMVVPLALVGGLSLAIAVGGYVLLRIPVVGVAGAALFGLLLLGGLVLMLVVLAFVVGGGMLVPSVASEGVDAIDATQRTYAYVLGRPVRAVLYLLLVLLQGLLIAVVLAFVVRAVVGLTAELATAWLPDELRYQVHAAATLRHVEVPEDSSFGLGAMLRLVALWSAIPGLIAGSILVSYIFAGTTVMYLLMRRVCDGQDESDLWVPGAVAGTMNQTRVSEADATATGADDED